MVDVGSGQKMHLLCKGQGKPVGKYNASCQHSIFNIPEPLVIGSKPNLCVPVTVILDAPTGMSSDIWFHVQESMATVTKVGYDYSGDSLSEWDKLKIRSYVIVVITKEAYSSYE